MTFTIYQLGSAKVFDAANKPLKNQGLIFGRKTSLSPAAELQDLFRAKFPGVGRIDFRTENHPLRPRQNSKIYSEQSSRGFKGLFLFYFHSRKIHCRSVHEQNFRLLAAKINNDMAAV